MSVRLQRRKLKFVAFDMDGVLADVKSSWQFVHEAFGRNNSGNLNRYKRGEITYDQFIESDIALWGHVHIRRIKAILDKVPIMLGAREVFKYIRLAGLRTALISAGIAVLAERLKACLNMDHVFANEILADEQGFLTGEGIVRVSLLEKMKVLEELSITESFSLAECAVVGDSSYDVPMFRNVGVSIAFNSDEKEVRESADVVIENKDLREILPYLVSDSRRFARQGV